MQTGKIYRIFDPHMLNLISGQGVGGSLILKILRVSRNQSLILYLSQHPSL